jgi:hypothetical protein
VLDHPGFINWTVYGLNNYLEAKNFMPALTTNYMLVTNYVACFGVSIAAARLFKLESPVEPFWKVARKFWVTRTAGSWAWRLLVGLAIFPTAYFFFGELVAPFVLPYYECQ